MIMTMTMTMTVTVIIITIITIIDTIATNIDFGFLAIYSQHVFMSEWYPAGPF